MRVLLLRLAAALPIAAFIAIALSLLSQRGIQLMLSGMTLVNMALILLPFLCNVMAVVLAPDRKREYILRPRTSRAPPAHLAPTSPRPPSRGRYMLCLALFHAFFGYTTLAVPLSVLVPMQVPVSIGFIFSEYARLPVYPPPSPPSLQPTLTLTTCPHHLPLRPPSPSPGTPASPSTHKRGGRLRSSSCR
jgi:hypothetical protein